MTSHNGHGIKPLKSRLTPAQLEAREAKKQEKAVFHQRVERTFREVGKGMETFDLAIVTVYTRFKRYAIINMILWWVLVAYLVWERMR